MDLPIKLRYKITECHDDAMVEVKKHLTIEIDGARNVTLSSNFAHRAFVDAWRTAIKLSIKIENNSYVLRGILDEPQRRAFRITASDYKKVKGVIESRSSGDESLHVDNGDDGVWEGEEE